MEILNPAFVFCCYKAEHRPKTCLSAQVVHLEMEEALHKKDELNSRVQSYISEVSRIEKLMATKVRSMLSFL